MTLNLEYVHYFYKSSCGSSYFLDFDRHIISNASEFSNRFENTNSCSIIATLIKQSCPLIAGVKVLEKSAVEVQRVESKALDEHLCKFLSRSSSVFFVLLNFVIIKTYQICRSSSIREPLVL